MDKPTKEEEKKVMNWSWFLIVIMLVTLMGVVKSNSKRDLMYNKAISGALMKKYLIDTKEAKLQKGYSYRAAIELNRINDECRTCRRKKFKSKEYLYLITKIK